MSCVSVVRIWIHENWIRVEFEDWGTQIFWSFFNHYWRIHFYPFFVCPCWPLPISSSTQCLFFGEAFQEGRSNGRTRYRTVVRKYAEIPWFGWKLAWRHSYHRYIVISAIYHTYNHYDNDNNIFLVIATYIYIYICSFNSIIRVVVSSPNSHGFFYASKAPMDFLGVSISGDALTISRAGAGAVSTQLSPAVTSCHQLSTSNTSRSSISSLKSKPWMILRMNSNIGNSSKPLSINRSSPMTSQQWYDGLFLKASTRATCPCLRMTSWMATWMLVTTRQLSPLWHHKNPQKPLWL